MDATTDYNGLEDVTVIVRELIKTMIIITCYTNRTLFRKTFFPVLLRINLNVGGWNCDGFICSIPEVFAQFINCLIRSAKIVRNIRRFSLLLLLLLLCAYYQIRCRTSTSWTFLRCSTSLRTTNTQKKNIIRQRVCVLWTRRRRQQQQRNTRSHKRMFRPDTVENGNRKA